jgi:hypothetical protein
MRSCLAKVCSEAEIQRFAKRAGISAEKARTFVLDTRVCDVCDPRLLPS